MKKIILLLVISLVIFVGSSVEAMELNDLAFILDSYEKVQCGDNQLPLVAAKITQIIFTAIQVIVPIIIIILGMLDLSKAMMSQKEDEIKKGRQTFFRRLLIGVSVFLVVFLVEILVGLTATSSDGKGMLDCIDCFINGDCK